MSRHVVYNTDNAGLPGVDDDSVHLTVTSPPYVTTEFFEGQEFDYDGFVAEFGRLCNDLYRVTVAGGRFALNVADIVTKYRYDDDPRITRVPLGSDLLQAAMRSGFRLLERYIWDKGYTRNFGGPLLGSYPYPPTIFNNCYFEYIWILQKPGRRRVSQEVREQSRLAPELWRKWAQQWWRIESITERISFHRAVFPIEIPLRLIQMYSFFGDLVLDPYMGTGATMIAADYCDRRSIGFEIDANCSDLLRRRVELDAPTLFTGKLEYDLVIPERS